MKQEGHFENYLFLSQNNIFIKGAGDMLCFHYDILSAK